MTTALNQYLQRADDFIQQQIYKFEQKKQGREYNYAEMQNSPQHPPRAQTFAYMPPQGPPAPKGWSQQFDQQSQRWYYTEHSSGHSQWEPPSMYQSRRNHRHIFSEHQQPQNDTRRDEELARRLQEEEEARARGRHGRSSSHVSHPTSGQLGVPQPQRPVTTSPHPSAHGRLPLGAYLDMRTGQVVTSMYPPGHSGDWTRPE
ncbi:hypothetical protein EK21DRAFT_89658 [Setomelanomma holmii]|uniref:WW domain-containing protein n=1 Tax=Setomelanomma holmii TaxID=210430 RepID=A0A9P4LMD3_9PLEO|nr:hypothetical protein EK21DRAFT_89658 [Setomelanomma holmii]